MKPKKIKIFGNVIKIKSIDAITEISSPCGHLKFDDSEMSNDDEDDWIERFDIILKSNKTITILAWNEKYGFIGSADFEELRDQVVDAWNKYS